MWNFEKYVRRLITKHNIMRGLKDTGTLDLIPILMFAIYLMLSRPPSWTPQRPTSWQARSRSCALVLRVVADYMLTLSRKLMLPTPLRCPLWRLGLVEAVGGEGCVIGGCWQGCNEFLLSVIWRQFYMKQSMLQHWQHLSWGENSNTMVRTSLLTELMGSKIIIDIWVMGNILEAWILDGTSNIRYGIYLSWSIIWWEHVRSWTISNLLKYWKKW